MARSPGEFNLNITERAPDMDLPNLPDGGLNTGVYTIDNNTFDGGTATAHGYITNESIPDSDFSIIAHYDNDPSKVGMFAYEYGDGLVVANTIPYSHYFY